MAVKITTNLTRPAITQTTPDFTDIEAWNKIMKEYALHNYSEFIKRDINISSDQLSRTDIIYLTDAYVPKPLPETIRNAINAWVAASNSTVTRTVENIPDSDVPAVTNNSVIDQAAIDAAIVNP